jgi:hypothetical protein
MSEEENLAPTTLQLRRVLATESCRVTVGDIWSHIRCLIVTCVHEIW